MERLNDYLPSAVVALVARSPNSPEKVSFAWTASVGPALARATSAELRDDGVLTITATNRAWAKEIRRSSAMILARLAPLLGAEAVRKLRVIVSDGGNAVPPHFDKDVPA